MAPHAKQGLEKQDLSVEGTQPTNEQLSESELSRVSGGFNPQPDPPAVSAPRIVSLPPEKFLVGRH